MNLSYPCRILARCLLLALASAYAADGGDAPEAWRDWDARVGRADPDSEGKSDPYYGAESNPTGDPVGGGTGYRRVVGPEEATVTVRDAESFVAALESAADGAVIYVPDDAVIDLTAYKNLEITTGTTIAGGRGIGGSEGGLLFTYTVESARLFRSAGPRIRVTGLRLEGSYPGRERLTQRPTLIGLSHPYAEIDNCEIFAWSCAAIGVGSSSRDTAWVHHNYIHHNQRNGLGYGVSLGRTHVLIEANLFDFCRHAIASSGTPGSGYTARYNVHLENTISHCFDMHGARDYEKYRQVGLWHFDDNRGETTDDYSIYNGDHEGRLVGMGKDAWVEGKIGRAALRFDGRDDYVDLGKQRQLSPKDGLSVAAWIKPESVEGTRAIFSKGDSGPSGSGYSLRIADGRLEGALYDAQGRRVSALAGRIEPGKWQYAAMTWDGPKRGNCVLYIDGREVGRFSCNGTRKASPAKLLVGRDSATATSHFLGVIDEARLYNGHLTADDVRRQFEGHGDIAGDLLLVHHNTFRATDYAALTVRGRPSTGCWAHRNRLYAPEGAPMFRQHNAQGNFHIFDNRFAARELAEAPDYSKIPPIHHWTFDPKRDGAIVDSAGDCDGALNGLDPVKAFVPSETGHAVRFDGEEGRALFSRDLARIPTDRFAVGMRFRYDEFNDHDVLLDNNFFRFFHRGSWASHRIYFLVRIQGDRRTGKSAWNGFAGVVTQTSLEQGQWYDIVAERDGDSMRIYLNGKLEHEERCLSAAKPDIARAGDLVAGRGARITVDDLWVRPASSVLVEEKQRQERRATLFMTGEEGYGDDGVEPESGGADTMFRFRVLYRESSGKAPAIGFPRVHVLRGGRPYINEAPVSMMPADDAPYGKGRVYTYSMRLPRGGDYQYFFEAETVDGERFTTKPLPGPRVMTGSFAPVLSWTSQAGYVRDGVEPEIGDVATDFDFRILFSDLDGDDPAPGFPKVHIYKGKAEIPNSPFAMEAMNDTPTYNGRPYRFKTRLAAGEDYSYLFSARDTDGNEAPMSLRRKSPTVDAGKDIAPPGFSDIDAQPMRSGKVAVSWQTDEPASGFVEFGPEATYGSKLDGPQGRRTRHEVTLSGLRPATTYHFRVGGEDEAGNRALSGDYRFTTAD